MKKKPLYEFRPMEGVYSFQIDVPHRYYGECDYFIPEEMQTWLKTNNLHYSYCGGGSWGDGYTDGITNKESCYIVRDASEQDGLAFQIQFPFCKTHISQQYDYV